VDFSIKFLASSKGKVLPRTVAPSSKQIAQTKQMSMKSATQLPVLALSKRSGSLPEAITMSVEYLLKSGFDVEGVFDATTENSPKIQTYLRSFHEGLGQFVVFEHVSEAAGCFLAHLATVPEPLLSYELHTCFLAISDEVISEEEKIGQVRNILYTLPSNALALIKYVVDFCAVLVSRCRDKHQGLDRMGGIIAPILLQHNPEDLEFPAAKNITKLIIKYHLQVFRKSTHPSLCSAHTTSFPSPLTHQYSPSHFNM